MDKTDASIMKCGICLEAFKNPKFLPCYHSFCSTCLKSCIKNSFYATMITCPMCRKLCTLPKDGVDGLVTNFYVCGEEIVSTCVRCKSKQEAKSLCLTCDQTLCMSCQDVHVNDKRFKQHSIVDIKLNNKDIVTKPMCWKHPKIKPYCVECEQNPGGKNLVVKHISDIDLPCKNKVSGLAPFGERKAWISLEGLQDVHIVDIHGNVLQSVYVGSKCYGAVADGEGNCIITCRDDKIIKKVTKTGSVETILGNVENLHDVAYRNNEDGFEIVYVESGLEGGVCLTRTGTHADKILGRHNVRSIATNQTTGMFCVSAGDKNEILIFGNDGSVMSRYSKGMFNFDPHGVCFDKEGCVIVANYESRNVLRINKDGMFVQTLVEDLDFCPESVAIDVDNCLWLGLTGGHIKVYKLT